VLFLKNGEQDGNTVTAWKLVSVGAYKERVQEVSVVEICTHMKMEKWDLLTYPRNEGRVDKGEGWRR
jgi:hypothetical protein